MTNSDNGNEIETIFCKYFIDKNEKDEIDSLQDVLEFTSSSSYFNNYPEIPLNEKDIGILPESYINDYFINLNNPYKKSLVKDKIFDVPCPKTVSLFSRIESNLSTDDDTLYKRKKFPKKRRRRDNQDNMRKKIKRGFLNNGLIKNLNILLKNNGIKIYLSKFQKHFVSDVGKKTNKVLINMTLEDIFKKKELYHETELKYYHHNLKLLERKEIQENEKFKNILNKKYCELFEEYINSKEFMNDEINRLKKNKMEESYIKRYIYLARTFIKFICE